MLGFGINIDGLVHAMGFGYYVLVYGIGALAMALSISAYQFRRRVSIIIFNCFGQLSWVAHFVLQGDLTSAIACGLTAAMLALFSKKDKWKWATGKLSVILFITVITVFSILTFKVWSDVFPLLAGVLAVIANCQSREKRLRIISVFYCLSWACNSTFKIYPIALSCDLMCTVSAVVSLIRYRNSDKKDHKFT